jgi:hypothetical protein
MTRKDWLFFLSATTCLTSGLGVAQAQTTKFVAVNPIVVCASNGSGCAPFNTSSATGKPGAANPTLNFVNSAGTDIAAAILNQIGVGLAYTAKPDGTILIQQYNSPPNVAPPGTPSYTATDFRELHVFKVPDPSGSGGTIFQSYDFLALSGYQPSTPLNPPVPLAQSLILNEFFVNKIDPDPSQAGSTIYEWSWKNANGFVVAAPTFFPPFPLTPRTGVPAHGIGHDLDTDHNVFGAGPDANGACSKTPFTGCAPNLMTTGTLRTEPTVACILMSPPSTSCASMSLPNGTADQLTLETEESPTLTVSQQRHMLLSNFLMNPLPSSTTTAFKFVPDAATAAATTANASSTASTSSSGSAASKSDTSVIFDVRGPDPRTDISGDSLDLVVITIEKGAQLDPQNPPVKISAPPGISVSFNVVQGNQGNGPALCSDPSSDCVFVKYSPGLPESAFSSFSVGIRKPPGPVDLCALSTTGLFATFKFHNSGLTVTSALTGSPPNCSFELAAGSQFPVSGTLTFDPTAYVPPSGPSGPLLPCTPVAGPSGSFFCPSPILIGGADGDANDNVQPPGPTGGSAPR